MEGAVIDPFHFWNHGVENEAVAVAAEPVEVASAGGFVVREAAALHFQSLLKAGGLPGEFFGEADIEEVEAVAELDDGSDGCGLLYFAAP